MNNIIKISAALAAAISLLSSCRSEEAPLASSVSVDKTELNPDGQKAFSETVNVTSDGDWIAVAPEWLKVEPMSGTGNAKVSISGGANLDTDGTLAGTRRATVSFLGNEASASVKVVQSGDPAKDLQRTYKKVDKITSGKNYMMVASGKAANPVPEGSGYGWLNVSDVIAADDLITMPNPGNGFTFTAEGNGFTIRQQDNRYLYQQGSYDSFNVSDEPKSGNIWTVEAQKDGTFKITNVSTGKYVQYDATHTSYGAYPAARGEMPVLYEEQPMED